MRRIFLKLWRRRKLHQDLETELAFHRDMARDHNNYIPLGNTTAIREQAFELWRFTFLENLRSADHLRACLRLRCSDAGRAAPVYNIRTFAGQKADSLARERLIALLSGFFGALALLLAAIGLYGVMAYAVLRRMGEIGVRLSLGAARSTVVWMVFRSALGMAVAGIVIGLPLSLWLSRLVTSQLYGVRPSDLATLATACIVMAGIAVLAASIPAWRASRVDPMVALRYE
jgi:ABC-type lipoprotein release transport system permease subunit